MSSALLGLAPITTDAPVSMGNCSPISSDLTTGAFQKLAADRYHILMP